jgi:hypothetical protein
VQEDTIAKAIRDALMPRAREGAIRPNAGSSLADIAEQLTRIADALEELVEIESEDEDDDEDD